MKTAPWQDAELKTLSSETSMVKAAVGCREKRWHSNRFVGVPPVAIYLNDDDDDDDDDDDSNDNNSNNNIWL